MTATRKLEVQITGEDRGASNLFGSVGDAADGTESRMSKWSNRIAGLIGGAFAVDTIIDWGATFINAAEESEKVSKQTEAVITSMGNAAGVSAEQVADLAESISLKTGLDDEMIQSGENVLLTFGNIKDAVGEGNDIFTQATQIATDMSVAMGQDLQSSIVQVGKALNDPIAGIGALSRVGVQFSQDQVAMIQQLVATGDTLGAQKVILAELTNQFGGSAEAQATASDKLAVAWGNVEEQLGMVLLPLFNQVATWLSVHLPIAIATAKQWIDDHREAIDQTIATLKAWGQWIEQVASNIIHLAQTIGGPLVSAIRTAWEWGNKLVNILNDIPGIGGGGLAREGHILEDSLNTKTGKTIPKMAAGGIVTRPTLALVGESGPEAVVPLGRGGMGGDVHVHLEVGTLVGRDAGRELIDVINRGLASGGRLQAQGRGL